MKRIYILLACCLGLCAPTRANEMSFMTVLSQPVGSFSSLEVTDAGLPVQAQTIRFDGNATFNTGGGGVRIHSVTVNALNGNLQVVNVPSVTVSGSSLTLLSARLKTLSSGVSGLKIKLNGNALTVNSGGITTNSAVFSSVITGNSFGFDKSLGDHSNTAEWCSLSSDNKTWGPCFK